MSTTINGVVLSQRLKGHARRHREAYAKLPAPDADLWRASEVFKNPHLAHALSRYEIIREVPSSAYGDGLDRTNGRKWTTDPQMYHALDEAGLLDPDRPPLFGLDDDLGCPECGRCAFRNLDGERLKCKPCGHVGPKEAWR